MSDGNNSDDRDRADQEAVRQRAIAADRTDDRGYSVFRFDALAGGESVVLIEQDQVVYELRKTRSGKLLLNR